MKRFLFILTGAIMALYGSTCAAQPALAALEGKFESRLLQTALKQNADLVLNQRLATARVATKETQYAWDDEAQAWVPAVYYTYTYNSRGLWDSRTQYAVATNEAIERTIDIAYNPEGHEIGSVNQVWDGTGWVNSTRNRQEYDAQSGLIKLNAVDEWVNNNWQLVQATRFTYTAGPGNRVEQMLTETYANGTWTNFSKSVNTYNGSGTLPVSSTSSEWVDGAWVETERMTEIMYANGQLMSYVSETYDEEEEEWVKSKFTIDYSTDAVNKTTTMLMTQAMLVEGTWVPAAKITITNLTDNGAYLGEQTVTEMKTEFLVGDSWVTFIHLVGEYTRDNNGNVTEVINKIYDLESSAFVNLSRFVYSDFININTTGTEADVLAAALQLYPNPTPDKLRVALDPTKVQVASLSIHNLTGQQVFELGSVRGEATVDLSHLPSGVYMVRITGPDNIGITRKIVKQ